MAAALEKVLHRLKGVKASGSGWVACCPNHDDHIQSLQISERDDLSVGLHCHANCSPSAVCAALGLAFSDLYVDKDVAAKTVVATYDYKALDGTLMYQSVRFFPKEFRQRRPDGLNGWKWDMQPLKGKHVPYRLPELKGHNVVAIVEGEKDADRLWSIGIPATTNIGGAKKWGTSETKGLIAAGVTRVFILPDNDEAGDEHAVLVGKSVKLAQIAVSTIKLPNLPPHGDVSDWLNGIGTKEQLQSLMAATPYILPSGASPTPVLTPDAPADALDVTLYHLTDLGAAEAFRDRYSNLLRFDHQREQWLIWDGHYWRPDLDEGSMRVAHDHVRLMQRDATMVPEFLERKKYLDWAMGREKRGPLLAMLQNASALKPLAITGDQWDEQAFLLGCSNGIVDLTEGVVRPGERDDFITLRAGAEFDEDAQCPRWEKFLLEVFDGNVELVDWIWRSVGYSLTADMREQVFFVGYGSGSNGKSIFIDALEYVFGAYGHRADMRMFAGRGDEANAFQNADFRGKRLIFAAEVRPNSRMNEHVLKHFTGGETLRAEHKYGRSFTIRPVGKIWLGVNHRPKVADDSFGFWRRVRLIPFLRTFAGSAVDPMLKVALRAEASGILAWAVRGCLEWQKRGLEAPAIVREATEEYQQGEDPLADFFDSRLVINADTADSVVTFTKLYAAYREWATAQGINDREKMTAKLFGNHMASRPFTRVKFGSAPAYKGFELAPSHLFT